MEMDVDPVYPPCTFDLFRLVSREGVDNEFELYAI
jgi:hypothetical protein